MARGARNRKRSYQMSDIMEQEVPPPRDGKLQKIAVTAAGGITALAATVLGVGWIRAKAVGADIDLLFGKSTVPVIVQGAVGTDDVGYPILTGSWEEFYLTDDTHVSWDASANGTLVLWRAGRERVGRT